MCINFNLIVFLIKDHAFFIDHVLFANIIVLYQFEIAEVNFHFRYLG